MMTDPIADMLTRMRNSLKARRATVSMPHSKVKKAIADILLAEGYITNVEVSNETPATLVVTLKYHGKQPAIQALKRESKPGHRVYRKKEELPRVLNDYGVAILSTSRGLMTNKKAREEGVGGEIICSIY